MSKMPIAQQQGSGRQRGFSLVTAIFLLVVLAGLAGAIMNIFTAQQRSSGLDLVGVRAYQAARAGIEWGLYQQLRNNSCAGATAVAMPAGSTLSGFTVTVTCTWRQDNVAGALGTTRTGVATTLVAGSATLAGIDTTAAMVEGMRVYGAGIAPGTVIVRIDSANQVTVSTPALASGSAIALTYYSPLDQWDVTAIACNKPVCGASNDADYVQRQMQVRF